MLKVFYGLLEFVREMDRGMAMMRGGVEPGTYDRRRRLGRRCNHRATRKLRHALDHTMGHTGTREKSGGSRQSGVLRLRGAMGSLKRLGGHLFPGGGHRQAVMALLLAMTLWGSVFVATKEILGEAGPITVAAGRFAIGLLVLLPLAYRDGFGARLVVKPVYLLFGFTGVFLAYGLQNVALLFTSAGSAALIMAASPAAVVLMGVLFLRERLPIPRVLGLGLSLAGVVLVSGAALDGGGVRALLGNGLMAVSILAYGAYAAQGRVLGTQSPAALTTAASFAAGLLFMLPFVAGEIYLYGVPALGTEGWLILLYLGISTTAATFLLWNYALRHLEAGAAGLYLNLLPVTGLGFAVLFGGSVGLVQMAGGALAISGVLLGDYLVRRKTAAYQETGA